MRVADTARRSSPLAATAADLTLGAAIATKTRVRGIDLAGDAGTWDSTLPSAETHRASTFSCDETAAGRQEVMNLRLPGQYDERLLGSLGLQGPYYNWNRWYLPGVGRYLEPDRLVLMGAFNAGHGPDWFGYANGNPLRHADPMGLVPVPPELAGEVLEWIADMIAESGVGGTVYRDKWYCAQEYACPIEVDCGGTKLDLVSCGNGACPTCPPGGARLFVRYWCAYASSSKTCPGKTATLLKPAIGDVDGFVKVCWP